MIWKHSECRRVLWCSWAAHVTSLGEEMAEARELASKHRSEMALHETCSRPVEPQITSASLQMSMDRYVYGCMDRPAFRITGSRAWTKGRRNQIRSFPGHRGAQMKSFEPFWWGTFFSSCHVILLQNRLPQSIALSFLSAGLLISCSPHSWPQCDAVWTCLVEMSFSLGWSTADSLWRERGLWLLLPEEME